MNFERGEIADLAANEIWSEEITGILPRRSVRSEDAVAEKRDESVFSAISDAPFVEIQGQYRLDVLRFDGLDQIGEEELDVRIGSISHVSSPVVSHQSLLLGCFDIPHERLDADYVFGE